MTLLEIAVNIHRYVPELDLAAIKEVLKRRYQVLLSSWPWAALRGVSYVYTKGTCSTGTVSVSSGSTSVTGSDTTWTSSHEGMFIRFGDERYYYTIASVSGNTSLTISPAYQGADDLSDSSYTIFQHIYSLPSDVAEVEAVVHDVKVKRSSRDAMDRFDPQLTTTGPPWLWAPVGEDSNRYQKIRLFPIPDQQYGIRVHYVKKIDYSDSATCLLPEDLVEQFTLVSCYQMAATRNANYASLVPLASQQAQMLYQIAKEEDIRHQDLPDQVKDEMFSAELPKGDDFLYKHDVYWWDAQR